MFRGGVIGSPVQHSLSPALHRAAFDYLGIEGTSLPIDTAGESPEAVAVLLRNYDALSVTFPLKEAAFELCDNVDEIARTVGAVNTVRYFDGELLGRNVDGEGFYRAIVDELDVDVRDANVTVLGAGGAARSIVEALLRHGAGAIDLLVRQDRGQGGWFNDDRVRITTSSEMVAELVINATPTSLTNQTLELPDVTGAHEAAYVDLTYSPAVTPWMLERARSSERVANGLGMLIWQAKLQLEWWRNADIPVEVLKSAVSS